MDGDGAGPHATLTKTPTFALTFPHTEWTEGECAEGDGGGAVRRAMTAGECAEGVGSGRRAMARVCVRRVTLAGKCEKASVAGSVQGERGGSVRVPQWGVWTAMVRVPQDTLTLTPIFALTFPRHGPGRWGSVRMARVVGAV